MLEYTLEPANYKDYRDFLKTRFENLKSQNSNFSLNFCARKSEISKSLLQFIFKKKRHLSLDRMPKLAKTLKLSSEEEYFVYLLICKNSSQNPEIQTHFENILNRVRHESVKVSIKEPIKSIKNEKELYLDTLLMVLQTLTKLKTFKEDPEWILQNLKLPDLTEQKIKLALEILEKNEFIFRGPDGKLKSMSISLWRPDPYDPSGQMVFTKGAECVANLMKKPEIYRPAVYMSMCLAYDEKGLAEVEKIMIELHHRLLDIAKNSLNPTSAVQFGNFMLTVART